MLVYTWAQSWSWQGYVEYVGIHMGSYSSPGQHTGRVSWVCWNTHGLTLGLVMHTGRVMLSMLVYTWALTLGLVMHTGRVMLSMLVYTWALTHRQG